MMSPTADSASAPVNSSNLPPQILLSLATVPFLAGMVVGKVLLNVAQNMGQMSEEIFRGDRLPMIDTFTSTVQPTASEEDS